MNEQIAAYSLDIGLLENIIKCSIVRSIRPGEDIRWHQCSAMAIMVIYESVYLRVRACSFVHLLAFLHLASLQIKALIEIHLHCVRVGKKCFSL